MATGINNNMNYRILTTMFGKKSKGAKYQTINLFSWNLGARSDSFSSNSANQIIQMTVKKMQAALQASVSGVTGQNRQNLTATQTATEPAAPTQWEIERAVQKTGGPELLEPWLVDGKTKLEVNGRKVVANIAQGGGASQATAATGDTRAEAARSIARFGFASDSLDGDLAGLRDQLKQTAATLAAQDPRLSLAIEYALEDAFVKLTTLETSGTTGQSGTSTEDQRQTNLAQAESIIAQLNLGDGDSWGIRSMAEDLAVFGMDMTAISGDLYDVAETIRDKSKEMLGALEQRYAGTEAEYIKERNRITGASARLINGLEGAGVMSMASASLTGSFTATRTEVTVAGARIDANAVISIGNVIVDPLVLDLNGDGIDLKSAEEGVDFDMKGSGQTSQMGFIRGDDALLFVDSHGDGVVHDGRQLFGNTQGHANGFEMLAAYDDNGDGVIDEQDAIYDQLRVWVEKNEDGVCEKEETMSLREAGVKSINLGYENVREDDGKGNLIGQTGSFTRNDGTDGYVADVWLQEKAASPKA